MTIAVSVVIPARDAAETLADQLEALAAQDTRQPWEVLVVDNGSIDDTAAVAHGFVDRLPHLRVVPANDRYGAGHARNVGARLAAGTKLLFCDADDVVGQGWIDAMAAGLERYDAGGGPTEEASLNDGPSTLIRVPLVAEGLPLALDWLPRAATCNFGVRAEVLKELGGFDDEFAPSEDTEFCLRLQVKGYTLGFVPDAVVHLRHHTSTKQNLRQVFRWAKARPALFRQYREHGAPRRIGARSLGGLLLTSWELAAGSRRWRWLGRAARVLGRVMGSVRARTWYV